MMLELCECMHSTEKAHDTTPDNENTSQHVTSVLVMALCNQPKTFASDLGDDQSRYLYVMSASIAFVLQPDVDYALYLPNSLIVNWMWHLFDRQERQELEDRLSVIESRQRQLEAQDRLIAETLSFTPRSVAETVTDGLKIADKSHISNEHASHLSEHHGINQPSSSVTDVSSFNPVSLLPSSATESVHSAVALNHKPGVGSGLPVVPGLAKTSTDAEVGSDAGRIREFQDELLRRQTDRQHALLEARRRLQMRAEQLLESGLNLLSESPSSKHRADSHSHSLPVPSEKSHRYEVENRVISRLSGNDGSDMLQTQVSVSKPYKPELYQPKSLSEDTDAFEYIAADTSPGHEDMDDERLFVTPELKEGGRVRPCRVAEYSPSPSPHANDAANKSQQLSVSPGRSIIQSNMDDFNSLILQAQRDLEVRQRQMQDQLEALENEEQRLAEQQLRISSHLGSFPSKTQTFVGTAHSQPPTAVLDSCTSSSPDLVDDGVSPLLSASNTPSFSQDNMRSVKIDSFDKSGLSTWQDGKAVDSTSHQIHLSHSVPLLQSRNIHVTSDQPPPSGQSPVSFISGTISCKNSGTL